MHDSDLGVKVEFAEKENQSTWRKNLRSQIEIDKSQPTFVEPGNQSRIVEVESATMPT